MGSGCAAEVEPYHGGNRKRCEKGHELFPPTSLKVVSLGADYSCEGYLFCSKCHKLYKDPDHPRWKDEEEPKWEPDKSQILTVAESIKKHKSDKKVKL